MLDRAVNPPKRLISPETSSTDERSIRGVRRAVGQLQHRLALLQSLRPDDVAFVVDILHDNRIGAGVLASHFSALRLELHAKAQHGAAVGNVDVEAGLAQGFTA